MTTAALSARPVYAVTMWCDFTNIYVELPVSGGPPYITKYALTEGGLSKALATMRDLHAKANASDFIMPIHPLLMKNSSAPQRDNALAVLRKLKLV